MFADTVVPRDFDLIEVPFPERGSPELVKRGARLPRAEVPSSSMSEMVQVAVAGDVTEGEEIQAILTAAGIESELRPEDEADALSCACRKGRSRTPRMRSSAHDRAGRPDRRIDFQCPSAGRARIALDPLTRSREAGKDGRTAE